MDTDSKYSTDRLTVKIAGWLGLISHLSYYYTWVYLIPQPYDSMWFRFSSAALSLPLILIDFWPEKIEKWLPIYWNLYLMYILTIVCTYLTFQNNFSTMWVITEVMVVFILAILIDSVILLFLNLLVGISVAYLIYLANPFAPIIWSDIDKASIALIPVIVATSVLPNLAKKLASLEKNNALKSLAGSIAHEMRNPLAQIHGSLYLIQEQISQFDNKAAEYINNAHKVIKNGLQVIDITMDAVRDKPIDPDSFVLLSARDLVAETVKDYGYQDVLQAQKVEFKGGDFTLVAEPVIVKYVLYNLIQNAMFYIKALPDAEVIISVMPVTNQIEVRDTGPGIAPDIIPKLFGSFYTSGKRDGTGLGLAYCKRTMTALGGDIQCRSELGQYTAFTLSFPVLSAQQIEQRRRQEQVPKVEKLPKLTELVSLAGKTVLVAEDERISRMIVKGILERQKIRCLEAKNGREALDLLSEQHCDLILTDMQMPVMGGLELIQAVRQRERTANDTRIPIIALTSEEGDAVNAAIEFGVSDYLPKPVSIEGLVPKLRKLLTE